MTRRKPSKPRAVVAETKDDGFNVPALSLAANAGGGHRDFPEHDAERGARLMARQTTKATGPREQPGHIPPVATATNLPKPEHESCGRCRFFQRDDDGPTGACHRGPPRSGQAAGNWPVVRPGDWCGEFKGSAA